jgi:pyridine nucleotide-disulfide oxidoreductase
MTSTKDISPVPSENESQVEDFDLLILGSGAGAKLAAWTFASEVVRDYITGGNHVTTGRQVPFCLFTDLELACIGLSETEAKSQGISYLLFKVPMPAVLRARALVETPGFLKALVGANDDRILGFTAFGVSAGETMGAVQIAMIAGLPYRALRDAIIAHPTMIEGLHPLFSSGPSSPQVRQELTAMDAPLVAN